MAEFTTGDGKERPSLETIISKCGINTDEWEVKSFNISLSNDDKWWARLECKHKLSVADFEAIAKEVSKWSPKRSIPKAPAHATDTMLEIGLFDLHLGAKPYESKQEDQPFEEDILDCIDNLICRVKKPSLVLLPIAGDIFHADNQKLTTTKGTFVGNEFEGLWHEVVSKGFSYIAKFIKYVADWAPVRVIVVPGNHDEETTFSLGLFLDAFFSEDNRVEVDSGMRKIKYVSAGVTLIGIMHGDVYRKQSGVSLLANDVPELWSQSTYRELHHGHFHRDEVREENGVTLRCIPALCPTSWWEGNQGFRRQAPSLRALEYDLQRGLTTIYNEYI